MNNLANHPANKDADSRRFPAPGAPVSSDPVSGAMQDGDGAVRAAAGAVARPVQRRPGKPPGHAKPANSGRRKGVPNKSTKEIKAIAQKQGAKAVRVLVRLMTKSENETTRLKAAVELLDRGYGRPVTPSEISGADGGPIETNALTGDLTAHEKMRALAAGLRRGLPDASWPAGPGKARPDLTRPIEVGADKLEMLIEGGWLDWDKSDDREAVTAAIEAFLAHGGADHDPGVRTTSRKG